MPDREKVIKGLECCTSPSPSYCRQCSYKGKPDDYPHCVHNRLQPDALALLKAQEPRVMTLEEVIEAAKQGEPMYICEAKFPGSARWIIPINADHWGFEERGSHCQLHYYDYLSKQIGGFCCWTSRPTDAQREAAPWTT